MNEGRPCHESQSRVSLGSRLRLSLYTRTHPGQPGYLSARSMADVAPAGDGGSPRQRGDSDVDMQPADSDSRRKNRAYDDQDEDGDEEDDEGIDLRPGAGSPGDSSEEEETDSEEEREIRKGDVSPPRSILDRGPRAGSQSR